MDEEAVILDGDERVLQVGRDLGERHVVPLLVQAEPAAAVGGEEPRCRRRRGEACGRPMPDAVSTSATRP